MRAVIYCRISKDTDGHGAGVARQEADCRAYCDQRGWDLAAVHVDNSRSAFDRRKVRPAYRDMMAAVQAGGIDAIVVWHLDRLYRHPIELEEIIELVEARKVTVATVTGGDYDLTTTDGRAMARVVVAFARKEVEDKSRRHVRQHAQLAAQGKWPGGGTRPFGYSCSDPDTCTTAGCAHDRGMSLIPTEADHVRHAARAILNGGSLRSQCRQWNADGVRTVTGKPWHTQVLRNLLTSSHVAGLRSLHGEVTAAGQWPPILAEADWRRLRVLLLDPARRRNERGGARRYLLTGVLMCGNCGARMVARPKQDRRRQYVCATGPNFSGCGKMAVLAEPIEHEVVEILADALDSPALANAVDRRSAKGEGDDLMAMIEADEASLEQLARDHYVDGLITKAQFVAASQGLHLRVEATRRRLVREQVDSVATAWVGQGSLAKRWGALSLAEQRKLLATFVEAITIGPAVRGRNWFDRDRILPERGGGITWRF